MEIMNDKYMYTRRIGKKENTRVKALKLCLFNITIISVILQCEVLFLKYRIRMGPLCDVPSQLNKNSISQLLCT